jgi:hypothetical protein
LALALAGWHPSPTRLEVYEDGSATLSVSGTVVRVYQDDTFPWSCSLHGDRVCGPVA